MVSKFEYDLLRILNLIFGQFDVQQGLALVKSKASRPSTLSPNCVAVAQRNLAKGLVLFLIRSGGWRSESFLENRSPKSGRIWDRVALDIRKLVFSEAPLDFLIWITANNPADTKEKPEKWDAFGELTAADELFFALAGLAFRNDSTIYEILKLKNAFSNNPIAWLLHPSDFVSGPAIAPPNFQAIFTGTRAAILECLQPILTKHWLASERTKSNITDWTLMDRQGAAELAMFTRFLEQAEKSQRLDLARFLLRTLSELFRNQTPDATFWTGGLALKQPTRLADRIATQRNALAVVQQAELFARWDRAARSVGYFDEEYQASQLLKEDYEAANVADFAAKVKRALEQLEPLKV
jgi:FtsH ternary system domain X6